MTYGKLRLLGLTLIVLTMTLSFPATGQDNQRGFRNYQEIISGRKKLEQLSEQEKSEVFRVHRQITARSGGEGKSPQCEDARSKAKGAASELADYSRRLRSCAENEDFADDCSSEYRRVKNSYSDYESAVSEVGSNCR